MMPGNAGVLRFELRRAFHGGAFWIALVAALALALLQLASVSVPYALGDTWETWRSGTDGMPPTVWGSWMGATSYSIWSVLFYYLAPLLCCAPFASTLCSDLQSGYASELLTRSSTAEYLRAKVVASCLTAVVIVVVPQIVNLIGTMLFLPIIQPDPVTGLFPISPDAAAAELFYENPWAYTVLFLVIGAVVAALLACFSLVCSLWLRSPLLVLLLPFLVSVLLNFLFFTWGITCYAPNVIIAPYQGYPGLSLPLALAGLAACSLALGLLFACHLRRADLL